MANSNTWDIHSSLHRNPSTATGASMFSNDYYPHRYGSRRSIASTVAGPPPVSPRSGGPPPLAHNLRDSAGSPWPIPSAPSSPAPAPPPTVQTTRGVPGGSRRIEEPSPLTIPPVGTGRVSPVSPRTPAQQPQQRQSRASMEQEFTQKHVQLVDQAKVLLAEMRALQILGPIHGAQNTNSTATHSDDGTNSSSYLQSDDASSLLSGRNTATNNTAVYYEQDETAMSALSAILAGKLGSIVSKPPPRPVRALAREVVSKVGPATSPALLAGSEGEADAIELLMEDYQAVLDWARSSSSSVALSSASSSSSSMLSVQPHTQGQTQTQARIQRCLSDRQALLEAALPSHLAHLCVDAMMHFGHEKLYAPSVRVSTPSIHSEHNGHYGNGNSNGTTSGGLSVNGPGGRERGSGFQQSYANSQTFRDGTPIEEIPRHRFMRTDDGYAWDMSELASELHHEIALRGGDGRGALRLRNPITRSFFAPADVSRILAHPMGRALVPSPLVRAESPSLSPRPSSPLPLPEPVSSLVQTRQEQDGEYRGYNSNENNGPEMTWPSPLTLRQPPPPPYSVTSEPPAIPRSPPPPLPLSTTTAAAVTTVTISCDHETDSYLPEPLRPYSPQSSPPPVLGAANSAQAGSPQYQQDEQLPEPVPHPIPIPRPIPGTYPTSWEEREQENDERFNPDYARHNRSYELLAASPPRPVSITSPSSAPVVGPNPRQRITGNNPPPGSTTSATSLDTGDSINDPSTGGEYRSSYLGNNNPFSSLSPFKTTTSQGSPTNNNNNNNTTTLYQSYRPALPSNPPSSLPSAPRVSSSQFSNDGMSVGEDTGKFSRNSYLAAEYGVATPPPSGPIPVSSLGGAASTSNSTSEHRYQFNAYPFPSLAAGSDSVAQQEDQRGRTRENLGDASGAAEAGGKYPLVNPFASSRDNSADGRVEMDAGPFELDDNPPRLTLGNLGRRGNSTERDDDADSREWMESLSSVRR